MTTILFPYLHPPPKFFEENPKAHRIFTTAPGKVMEILTDNELDAIRLGGCTWGFCTSAH